MDALWSTSRLHPCSCVKPMRWYFAVCPPVWNLVSWALIRTAYFTLVKHPRNSIVNTATLFQISATEWFSMLPDFGVPIVIWRAPLPSLFQYQSSVWVSYLPLNPDISERWCMGGRFILSSFQRFQSVIQRSCEGQLTSWLTQNREEECAVFTGSVFSPSMGSTTNMYSRAFIQYVPLD